MSEQWLTLQQAVSRLLHLYHSGQLAEAEQWAKQLLQSAPTVVTIHHLLGAVFAGQNKLDEAAASFASAIRLTPGNADLHNDLGYILQIQGKVEAAAAHLQQAIQLNPQLAAAHCNLGNLLLEINRLEEAAASYERALQIKPNDLAVLGLYWHVRCQLCDWADYAVMTRQLKQSILQSQPDNLLSPFPILAIFDDPELHLKASQAFSLQYQATQRLSPAPPASGKIKIAYLSADFKQHPVAYLMVEVFELHDRERFEVYGFSYGIPIEKTPIRLRLERGFDHFFDISSMPDADVLNLLQQQGIHILVDLTGYTGQTRSGILAARPAPVQVQYLGYPGSLGADFIDYMIADKLTIPEQFRQYYREKVVFMPHSFQPSDSRREIAEITPSRQECGLPEHAFVFCCFNTNYKITPQRFELWCRILRAVPDSVLWLFAGNPVAASRLRLESEQRGIEGKRLIFAERVALEQHLARIKNADLFLDTAPYNAGATASDTLWAEVPVLTQSGNSFVSRMAASLLYALAMPELVTATEDEYVEKAIYLAKNPGLLKELKAKIAANKNTTPLFNTALLVRHLEMAYLAMWQGYTSGQAPQDINIRA